MSSGILLSSTNFNGQATQVTFYPDTGGTVNIGTVLLPYTFVTDYYYGSYELYFSAYPKTCYAYMSNPDTNLLLQENFALLQQEDLSSISLYP